MALHVPLILQQILFMRFLCLFLACATICVAGCTNQNNKAGSANAASASANQLPSSKLDDAGTQTLMAAMRRYYELKNALVVTNASKADSAAKQLHQITDSLKTCIGAGTTANKNALNPYLDTIINESNIIAGISDATCEKQRLPFSIISSAMFGLLKKTELKNRHVYQQYCPMAFNEKGAYWLSNESEIQNPYFGKKMLECGDVTDSLK